MAIHDGHRARMREKFLRHGFDSFADHEVLEYLLFSEIPYKDTNQIAHRLLARFGSLSGVFHASSDEILTVKGCGMSVAVFLAAFREAGVRGFASEEDGEHYSAEEKLRAYILRVSEGESRECTRLILLDNHYRILDDKVIHIGNFAQSDFPMHAMTRAALSTHASMAVLASTHPGRFARPDEYEMTASAAFSRSLSLIGVPLLEHYLISSHVIMPMSSMRRSRRGEAPYLMVGQEHQGEEEKP